MKISDIKNFFIIGKNKRHKESAGFFKTTKDIIVNSDIVKYKPAKDVVEEIKSKFDPVDYSELSFDEQIDNYNLNELSDETKSKIIQLIKQDLKDRHEKLEEMYGNWRIPERKKINNE